MLDGPVAHFKTGSTVAPCGKYWCEIPNVYLVKVMNSLSQTMLGGGAMQWFSSLCFYSEFTKPLLNTQVLKVCRNVEGRLSNESSGERNGASCVMFNNQLDLRQQCPNVPGHSIIGRLYCWPWSVDWFPSQPFGQNGMLCCQKKRQRHFKDNAFLTPSFPRSNIRVAWSDLVSLRHCFLIDIVRYGQRLIRIQGYLGAHKINLCTLDFYSTGIVFLSIVFFILLQVPLSRNILQIIRKKKHYFTFKAIFKSTVFSTKHIECCIFRSDDS